MNQIIVLDQMRQRLAVATDVADVREVRDKAESLRLYARKVGKSLHRQNQFAEIKIRAERRCGELLPHKIRRGGDRKSRSRLVQQTLKDLGVSKYQSHCW